MAATLTDRAVNDAAQVRPLLDQVTGPMVTFSGDGAYYRTGVYAAVQERRPEAAVVVPPRVTPCSATRRSPSPRSATAKFWRLSSPDGWRGR